MKAVAELSTAKEELLELKETSNPGTGAATEPTVKTEPGSGIDAFIAVMVHSSKCK
jgi:hypothetical protein